MSCTPDDLLILASETFPAAEISTHRRLQILFSRTEMHLGRGIVLARKDSWNAAFRIVLRAAALGEGDRTGRNEQYPTGGYLAIHNSLDTIEQGKYQTFLVSMMTRVIADCRD